MADKLATLSQLKNALMKVRGQIDQIEVGGRNLYTGTRDFSGPWVKDATYKLSGETYNGFSVMESDKQYATLAQRIHNADPGVYTLSVWVKCEGEVVIYAGATTEDNYHIADFGKIFDAGSVTEFTRVSLTFTVREPCDIMPRITKRQATAEPIFICGYKLERGHIATDWSPAPEDMQGAVTYGTDDPGAGSPLSEGQVYLVYE